jgi:monoamine oxidase
MAQPSNLEADVIIVGAGLSGMIAARKVLDAGLTPLVLEADERVGGRILTQ